MNERSRISLPVANLDAAKKALKQAGCRVTKQRSRILRVLEGSAQPMSIYAIVRQLGHGGANQATVYRSLRALEYAGVVRQVDLRHGHAHYELAALGDHHHLVCWECGRVEDFVLQLEGSGSSTDCGADAIIGRALAQSRHFSQIEDHAIELFGTCEACRREEASQ